MNGALVGYWDVDARGRHVFRYAQTWLERKEARPLSLSMPLQPPDVPYVGEVVTSFFDNLLTDSQEIRRRIQARFGTSSTNAFDLLTQVGRDCVGAVQLLPPDTEPRNIKRIESEPLTNAKVAQLLRETVTGPVLGQRDDDAFRISLAGMQEKTAFLWRNGRWHRPLGSTPTTHIFKLPLGRVGNLSVDLSASIENEWLCAQIMGAYGLRVAKCEIDIFEDQRVLVVERFDRRLSRSGKWWLRLPQEDMCQATATSPGQKYESDGGPGIRDIMSLLLGARDPLTDRREFFKAQVLFWLLAAPDGHAKNFSVHIAAQGEYSLTPIYDVISVYPVMGRGANKIAPEKLKMAMAVHGRSRHYRWSAMLRRHWLDAARECNFSEYVEGVISSIVERTPSVVAQVSAKLPAGFPEEVAASVFHGLQEAVNKLEANTAGK
ncbi:MAG: type II toxin-antitoxin system HipA family toxin [Gammaproteobacteria bacterium]|nr:type II toxin-antitoxin system HipA family toxin [Gammaproteobacteria bacterium]